MTSEKKHGNTEHSGLWTFNARPLTVIIVILLAATSVLFILNIHNYYMKSNIILLESDVSTTVKTVNPKLKPLRIDMARFEIEVVKPHKDMKAKFPNHPDMIINKLSKFLRKEENRYLPKKMMMN